MGYPLICYQFTCSRPHLYHFSLYLSKSPPPLPTNFTGQTAKVKLYATSLVRLCELVAPLVSCYVKLRGKKVYWLHARNSDHFCFSRHFKRVIIENMTVSNLRESNSIFATRTNCLIPIIYLQPECVNHWYFKLRLYDLTEFIV